MGYQRMRMDDFDGYKSIVARERRVLKHLSPDAHRDRARQLGRLGNLLLADETRVHEAISTLEEAHRIACEHGFHRLRAANAIRLATGLQYIERHHEAIALFDDAIAFIEAHRLRGYKDFALQHKGKCLVELGNYDAARRSFHAALKMRKRRGDEKLVASTQHALNGLLSHTNDSK